MSWTESSQRVRALPPAGTSPKHSVAPMPSASPRTQLPRLATGASRRPLSPLPSPHTTLPSRRDALPPLADQSPGPRSPLPVSSPDGATVSTLTTTADFASRETANRKLVVLGEVVERKRLLASANKAKPGPTNPASPAEAASPPDSDVEKDLLRTCLNIVGQAESLRQAGQLSQAYLLLSSVLPEFESTAVLWAQIRAQRACCSYALINFRECVDDCEAALAAFAHVQPAHDLEDVAGPSTRAQGAAASLQAERLLWTQLTRACVMREEYARAAKHYRRFLARAGSLGVEGTDLEAIRAELFALPAIQAFRTAVVNGEWEAAHRYMRASGTDGIAPLTAVTPLRAIEAVVLLELDYVDEARVILLSYLPTILRTDFVEQPSPTCRTDVQPPSSRRSSPITLMDCAPEEQALYRNLLSHYLQCTVAAAKASVYTSPAYLNIAAALVKRCLVLSPTFAPAMSLGAYLVAVEDHLTAVNEGLAKGDWPRVLHNANKALRLDEKNKRLASILHVYRAEAFAETDKPLNGIEACTVSIQLDPCNPRPFFLRGLYAQLVRQPAKVAADRQRAIELAPGMYTNQRFNDELAALEARQRGRAAARENPNNGRTRPAPPLRTSEFSQRQGHRPFSQHRPADSAGRPTPAAAQCSVNDRQTLYDLLQVPQNAPVEEVRKAYKRLILRFHPDKVVGESDDVREYALHMFKRINEAHNVLSDPAKRAAYDLSLRRPL